MGNFLLPSKTQLEAMVALTEGAAGLIDAEARVLYLNASLLGYSLDKVYGRSVLEGAHLDDLPYARQAFQRCLDQPDVPVHIQLRKIHTNGSTHVIAAVLLNKLNDPDIKAIVIQYRDITAEKAVEAQSRYLASIVEGSEDAIISYDLKGIIQSWNRAAERMYGYSAEEAIGQPVTFILPDNRSSEVEDVLRVIRTGGRMPSQQSVRRHKKGREVDVSVTISPITDVSGRVIGASSVARDLSEQQRLLAARKFLAEVSAFLSESLEYEETIQKVAKLALGPLGDCCSLDLIAEDGSIEHAALAHANPAFIERARELMRHVPATPRPQSVLARVIAGGRPILIPDITAELVASGNAAKEALELVQDFNLKSYVAIPLKARGRVLGVWSLARDATNPIYSADELELINDVAARVALQIDNARLYRAAVDANNLKDQFLATLSHELRTPLTAIAGWTAILKRSSLDADIVRQALDSIQRNVGLQSALVDDLLDVSRIVSGKMHLTLEPVNICTLVASAVENMRSAADAKAIRISVETHGSVEPIVCDPTRIQQVVWNLLSNAIKFTPSKGSVAIVVRSTAANDAEILVSDNGIGIPANFLPHIFERFLQFDGSSTRTTSGLGLGLSIVKHLVEMHGGTVRADSPGIGQGATFRVVLPRSMERAEPQAV